MSINPKAMAGEIPVYCSHDKIVSITKAIPNPRNPNKHPDRQIEILAKIIKEQGWRQPVTISNRSGFIVKGHGRYMAAIHLQSDEIPVDYQDYATEAEEWADLIADNRIAELSNIDDSMLTDLLEEMHGLYDIDMTLTGFDFDELDTLIKISESVEAGEDPFEPSPIQPLSYTDTTNVYETPTYNETPSQDYQRVIDQQRANTGEIDIEDYSEDKFDHECPKCKFRW